MSSVRRRRMRGHPGSVNIRFLRPDVVIADGFYQVESIKDANGKEQPTEKALGLSCAPR